jgi:hypothetical protein
MLDFLNLEKQIAKRVGKFLSAKAQEAGIEDVQPRLVISALMDRVTVQLYAGNYFVKTLDLQAIAEFFGQCCDKEREEKIYNFLKQLSEQESIPLNHCYILICEQKKQIGAHVYKDAMYVKKLPMLQVFNHFNAG